jgi:hypothetical protein
VVRAEGNRGFLALAFEDPVEDSGYHLSLLLVDRYGFGVIPTKE